MKQHTYAATVTWTGNTGEGTSGYRNYSRAHEITAPDKSASILGSADPAFRGDKTRYNPEEMLVGALSACHMLWALHLAADAGIVIIEYTDTPTGVMPESSDGSGQFESVTLRPRMVITEASRTNDAIALHERAHQLCYLARSVNFPVRCEPVVVTE
jgi:organic hydroperoxide reductase OsmC/OhrA